MKNIFTKIAAIAATSAAFSVAVAALGVGSSLKKKQASC